MVARICMICYDMHGFVCCLLAFSFCRCQGRKEAFEQRKRELKALGLGQDGRPIKKEDENKEVKSRGKVYKFLCLCLICFFPLLGRCRCQVS